MGCILVTPDTAPRAQFRFLGLVQWGYDERVELRTPHLHVTMLASLSPSVLVIWIATALCLFFNVFYTVGHTLVPWMLKRQGYKEYCMYAVLCTIPPELTVLCSLCRGRLPGILAADVTIAKSLVNGRRDCILSVAGRTRTEGVVHHLSQWSRLHSHGGG